MNRNKIDGRVKDSSLKKAKKATKIKKYDFSYSTKDYKIKFDKGLSETVIKNISKIKKEPKWMLDFRLKAYKTFIKQKLPSWGIMPLEEIDFKNITYFASVGDSEKTNWKDVPKDVKKTFDRIGVPKAERDFLAGVGAQYDSEVIYHKTKKEFEEKGVVFLSMDEGLKKYPELVKKYFGSVIPIDDNKFSSLNSAVWSGGSFVYVPKGVKVDTPLQAYFRINSSNMGQFERTLIIADEGSKIHYVEGCTAPRFSTQSLHAAVVEVIALEGASIRYTTIQNWANNIYNLVTKRAFAYKNASVEWVDGNLGSRLTMKYPAIYLKGDNSRGEVLSIAIASKNQKQDAGAKIVHQANNTTGTIVSKSISKDGGESAYRGLVRIDKGLKNVKSNVRCDAILIDSISKTDTYPVIVVDEPTAEVSHEATVGRIGEEQLFYLMSRGIDESKAITLIILGFISEFSKQIPLEYAVELNRLIEMEFENSVG
ncbi:Fe-S cluster assembly protein SufB [archaeon]|jgi:Fe-S cluster assembly protein SufB|nr:Fe-S cluster assembly protein SufB [archaeon]NCP78997.1 Fe-S cluster assembly protein SufB [archaeon]NCP97620.1 Fe-S cluster assembly protein SufB [archaeon]NCQ06764.1 Fe-S cluster assembly protein SufB [archaeon]NCQ50560.1 Fe-S cluster assembly protein SufB [archaeon]